MSLIFFLPILEIFECLFPLVGDYFGLETVDGCGLL